MLLFLRSDLLLLCVLLLVAISSRTWHIVTRVLVRGNLLNLERSDSVRFGSRPVHVPFTVQCRQMSDTHIAMQVFVVAIGSLDRRRAIEVTAGRSDLFMHLQCAVLSPTDLAWCIREL